MKKINVEELDIFQLHSLKEILNERAEYYSKSIPDYALMLSDGNTMTPVQHLMLQKYNTIKEKIAALNAIIEDYILNKLLNEKN